MVQESVRGFPKEGKGEARRFGDVQEAVACIREVEDPKEGELFCIINESKTNERVIPIVEYKPLLKQWTVLFIFQGPRLSLLLSTTLLAMSFQNVTDVSANHCIFNDVLGDQTNITNTYYGTGMITISAYFI